jgi:hypothetical protein
MKKEKKVLEQLKGRNPFKIPEGYLDGLTQQVMDRLPERSFEEPVRVSLWNRVLPWIYLAAAITGLGLFFDVLNSESQKEGTNVSPFDTYTVHSNMPEIPFTIFEPDEDADYLEYLETQYTSYILAEEIRNFE